MKITLAESVQMGRRIYPPRHTGEFTAAGMDTLLRHKKAVVAPPEIYAAEKGR